MSEEEDLKEKLEEAKITLELAMDSVEAATEALELPQQPEFIPEKYARRTCGTCKGAGVLRITPSTGPHAGQKIVTPCGCASKRYLIALNRFGHGI